jgi:polyphosphate:AMP phosphotransferase
MLETVDLKARVSRSEYEKAMEPLDLELGQLQRDLRPSGNPIVIVLEGWDASGKGTVLNRLLQPLDPRGFTVVNVLASSKDQLRFPPMRRFWLETPSRGFITIYNRSWYRQVLEERIEDGLSRRRLEVVLERIRRFERMLDDDGTVVLKFFLHISKKEQAARFKALSKDPAYAWKVGKEERRRHKRYPEYLEAIEEMLAETSAPCAPWVVLAATDERHATLRAAEALSAAMKRAVERKPAAGDGILTVPVRKSSPLDRVDLAQSISDKEYDKALPKLQQEARRLQHLCYFERKPVVIVFEGWDAAGKGGAIRRLVYQLDPRGYDVVPVSAPQGEEKTHHYLWRFWRELPKTGHFAIFDRSWYGRVLVERVEKFASEPEWERAYREINEFEQELTDFGAVVIKFFLHLSREEQLERFNQREQEPHKRWKLTPEDWRNREKWDDYWVPVSDMLEKTSTLHAPWTIVEGNDKRFARIKVLRTVNDRIKAALK